MTTQLLLSAPAAAQTLSISRRTLYSLTQSGAIKCVKLGSRVLYDPRDLATLIDSLKSGGEVS